MSVKTETDIFGNEKKSVVDENGRKLLDIKSVNDIFGNTNTTVDGDKSVQYKSLIMKLILGSADF
ncbi:hypothetical protein H9X96_11270 [Pedobacter sp. N36a]|uniref:hypothetical protein n=1 Tax=Pedobacter sp. N36a TaxID=2767996 RepID=UPI001656C629|nr:hypothetical protein [Pedobacter sp. N36a]MBC8986357.1 hypothetical protein [Pedobacter sp. N36a]